MADGQVALQSLQGLFIENLTDQPQVFENDDLLAVTHRNAGGLLAAVLQCEQPVVGDFCNVFARCPHAENSAFVVGLIVENRVSRYHDHQRSSYKATSPKR